MKAILEIQAQSDIVTVSGALRSFVSLAAVQAVSAGFACVSYYWAYVFLAADNSLSTGHCLPSHGAILIPVTHLSLIHI